MMSQFLLGSLAVNLLLWTSSSAVTESLIQTIRLSSRAATLSQSSFNLSVSPYNILSRTSKNASLHCSYNLQSSNGLSSIREISRIRILRSDSSTQWSLLAEIRDNEQGIHLYDNILAEGSISSEIRQTFLKIVWPNVTDTTFGEFRCDVIGFNANLEASSEETDVITIVERSLTALEVYRSKYNELLKTLNETIFLQANLIATCSRELLDMEEMLNRAISSLKEIVTSLTSSLFLPAGSYGLLAPQAGCPTSSDWKTGYIRLNTESSGVNHDFVPADSHVKQPMKVRNGTNNFMNISFCTIINSTGQGIWPAGSYCIHRVGVTCPVGFQSGYIQFDTNDGSEANSVEGFYVYFTNNNLYYCCRNDVLSAIPISLPIDHSFYLYRYGGACQVVTGMKVTNEYLIIDTENSSNNDVYENNYHPDGTINDVRLELCYYQAV